MEWKAFILLVAVAIVAFIAYVITAQARDAYTQATIACIERETKGKADEEINVDAVVLDCMEEAGPLDIPPIPRLPS